jgi:hypothetical protein
MFRNAYFSVAVLAAIVVVAPSGATTALAQSWQEYRPDDFGFKIEFPAKPEITEEKDIPGVPNINQIIKTSGAGLNFEGVDYTVTHIEYAKGQITSRPIEVYLAHVRKVFELAWGLKLSRENQVTVKNVPMHEFDFDEGDFHAILRTIALGDREIDIIVMGRIDLRRNPAVQRFLGSFELLPK